MDEDRAFRSRSGLLAALDGLAQSAHAIGATMEAEYGGEAVARARSIEAEAQALRRVLLPEALLDDVIETVARANGLTAAMIRSARRGKPVVAARWAVMAMAHRQGLSNSEIARALRCDHSSVAHGLARVAQALEAQNG